MSPTRAAKTQQAPLHLARADEFLQAAQLNLDGKLYEAAVSNAVVAGIRASDTICTLRLKRRWHGSDHSGAADLLASAVPEGVDAAPILSRLLRFKNRAQYGLEEFSAGQARDVVDHAEDLVDLARRAVATAET